MSNSRGSCLVESLLLMPIVCGLVAGALAFSYLRFARLWMDYQGFNAMMCMAENQSWAQCHWQFRRHANTWLAYGSHRWLNEQVTRRGRQLHFHSELHPRLAHRQYRVISDLSESLPQ